MNIEFSSDTYPAPASPQSISFSTSTSVPQSPVSSDSGFGDSNNWSDHDDQLLRAIVIADREKNWPRVASRLNKTGCDAVSCQQRWLYLLESEGARKIRGRWTAEEDDHLASLVHEYGTRNWRAVASHLPGRLPKQCRERWHNQLDPSVRKDGLTADEWKILHEAHAKYGNKWAEIVKVLPGRTANHIKNQWNTMMRRKESETSKKRKWNDITVNTTNGAGSTPDSSQTANDSDESSSSEAIEQILISPKRPKLADDSIASSSSHSLVLTPPLSPLGPAPAPLSAITSELDVLAALSLLRSQGVESFSNGRSASVPSVIKEEPVNAPFFPTLIEAEQFESSSPAPLAAPSSLSQFFPNSSVWSNYVDVLTQQHSVLADHRLQLAEIVVATPKVNPTPFDSLCSVVTAAYIPH
eukprot:TRINITY_DN921_c0_g2_i2.p1 TRINITY_DN921_c0_g2~~TRINITY_DN921_c0_g2_i2.p1  ORF type:complete len:412 (-),score=96.32 TRINITY_DN921_c0_g2_i2:457-1692(-)